MVAQAATTPLPQLSKPDKLRLTLYFAGGQSTEALAHDLLQIHRNHQAHLANSTQPPANFTEALITEGTALAPILSSCSSALSPQHLALPPDSYDLASWTLAPEIAPHIAYRRAESAERRKQTALQELDTILATSDSPIEKRRAATTMLRMLATQLTRSPIHSEPSGASRRSNNQLSCQASTTPTSPGSSPSAPSRIPPPPAAILNSSPHPLPSAPVASSPHSPLVTPHPHRPNPSLSPDQIITHITRALEHPENPDHLATFESFLSPQATINEEHAHPSSTSHEEPAHSTNRSPATSDTHTELITIQTPDSPAIFKVTLTRPHSGAHPNCWLLQSLEPDTT